MIDLNYVIQFLTIAIPLVVAFLLPSPLGKRIPPKIARVLAELTPATISDVVGHVSTPEARRDTAAAYLVRLAGKEEIYLSEETAEQVVDALMRVYRKAKAGIEK